jgi:prepilin-type N-terminal cleavage/methylation domain-containing protein
MPSPTSPHRTKAFTLIELVVVVTVIGILASVAAFSYNAVMDNARDRAVETAGRTFDREYRVLLAFDDGRSEAELANAVKADTTGVNVNTEDYIDDGLVEFRANGKVWCLTLADSYERPGLLAPQACGEEPVSGLVASWGWALSGQLARDIRWGSAPVGTIPDLEGVTQIAAGGSHSCALLVVDEVWCWGASNDGQTGAGFFTNFPMPGPMLVSGLTMVTSLVGGGAHTCALLNTNEVSCWGANVYGQLGDGGVNRRAIPGQVTGLTGVTQLTAGAWHTCALLATQTVTCWGNNEFGQLGNELGDVSLSPVAVDGLAGVISINAGDYHTCAVLTGGAVTCWGMNDFGQLGSQSGDSAVPLAVAGITNAVSVSGGYGHTCAVLVGGAVTCWGINDHGQLGSGAPTNSVTPQVVPGLAPVTKVATGGAHTCALTTSRTVVCWGNNGFGQMGDGLVDSPRLTPQVVAGLADVADISAGGNHTLALYIPGE